MTYFTLECSMTGETDGVTCCSEHAAEMPVGEGTTAHPADDDCDCDFCPIEETP